MIAARPHALDAPDVGVRGTVLLVDDEPDVLASLARLLALRFPALHVASAHDGPLAVRLAAAVDPDVVMTDYVMPGMSGLALLREIGERDPHAYRILVSAYGRPHLYAKAMTSGVVDALLQKPMEGEAVTQAVRRGLEVARDRSAHPPALLHAHGEVLLVSADEDAREVLVDHFRDRSARVAVRAVASGRAALDLLSWHRVDVLLCDARLPDREAAALLSAALEAQPHLRTALLGERIERTAAPAAAPGVDPSARHFARPLDPARFARAIEKLLPHDASV